MKFTELDSSRYKYNGVFFSAEFEELLSKMITCYKLMRADNVSLPNDENKIRDFILYNYLKVQSIKTKLDLTDYLFDPELPEDRGRIDIRIMPVNPFIEDRAYFIIECKRLDSNNTNGKTGLNAKYISEGMDRFVSRKYSAYYKTNGMIGFIMKPLDIHKNIQSINSLLTGEFKKIITVQTLTKKSIVGGFDYFYYSMHNSRTDPLTIYHLMFDFSMNTN